MGDTRPRYGGTPSEPLAGFLDHSVRAVVAYDARLARRRVFVARPIAEHTEIEIEGQLEGLDPPQQHDEAAGRDQAAAEALAVMRQLMETVYRKNSTLAPQHGELAYMTATSGNDCFY